MKIDFYKWQKHENWHFYYHLVILSHSFEICSWPCYSIVCVWVCFSVYFFTFIFYYEITLQVLFWLYAEWDKVDFFFSFVFFSRVLEEEDAGEADYLKQLILGAIYNLCKKQSQDTGKTLGGVCECVCVCVSVCGGGGERVCVCVCVSLSVSVPVVGVDVCIHLCPLSLHACCICNKCACLYPSLLPLVKGKQSKNQFQISDCFTDPCRNRTLALHKRDDVWC